MRTGIEFFDNQEPKVGDLWIVAGGPAQGKTTILRNIAVGLCRNGLPTVHWDVEHAAGPWAEGISRLDSSVRERGLEYRNVVDVRGSTDVTCLLHENTSDRHRAVVIDSINLVAGRQSVDVVAQQVKIYAVRRGVFMVAGAQLPVEIWRRLLAEGSVSPEVLPEWMLTTADAAFVVSKTSQRALDSGAADTLRVQVCKSAAGLRDPANHRAFIWDHDTGRIE